MEAIQTVLASPARNSVAPNPSREITKNRPRLPHIQELDGIRGIAALAVVFHHVCFTSIEPSEWGQGIRALYYLSKYGSTGVDLFFVLSGFLITSLLIQDRESLAYYRNFYWKRVLRILPLYVVCLLGVYFFVAGSHGYVLLAALFIVNFAQVFHVASTGPFWTLAIEEQFYLLWPTVVRRRSIEQLTRWSVGIGLGAFILRLIAAALGHHDYYFTFLHCDGLAIGAFIACRYAQRTGRGASFAAIPIGWIFIAGTVFLAAGFLPYGNQREFAFIAAAEQTGISLLCGAIIAFAIVHSGSRYLAIFRSRLFTFFGLISYALYMIHTYVLMAYDHLHGTLAGSDLKGYAIRFLTTFAVSTLLSVLTYYLIERPAMSLRKYVLAPSVRAHSSSPR